MIKEITSLPKQVGSGIWSLTFIPRASGSPVANITNQGRMIIGIGNRLWTGESRAELELFVSNLGPIIPPAPYPVPVPEPVPAPTPVKPIVIAPVAPVTSNVVPVEAPVVKPIVTPAPFQVLQTPVTNPSVVGLSQGGRICGAMETACLPHPREILRQRVTFWTPFPDSRFNVSFTSLTPSFQSFVVLSKDPGGFDYAIFGYCYLNRHVDFEFLAQYLPSLPKWEDFTPTRPDVDSNMGDGYRTPASN